LKWQLKISRGGTLAGCMAAMPALLEFEGIPEDYAMVSVGGA